MLISRVDIAGFGCLENVSFDIPDEKVMLVLADNEHGKSTLAAAIIAGLCGFPKRKAAEEPIKQSEVFRPWHSDSYSVNLLLDAGGRKLVVERNFAASSFQVRDAATNTDVSAEFCEDLAESLLALLRDDFRRIAVITGKDVHRFESSVRLKSQLAALVEGEEESDAEAAIAALEGARYTLGGSSLKIETALKRLDEQIEQLRASMAGLDSQIERLRPQAEELEDLQKREAELTDRLSALDREYEAARARETDEELRSAKNSAAAGTVLAVLGFALAAAFAAAGFLKSLHSVLAAVISAAMAAVGAAGAVLASGGGRRRAAILAHVGDLRSGVVSADAEARPSLAVDSDRQSVRLELGRTTDRIKALEREVGAALEKYRAEYPKFQEECAGLQAEKRKAERYQAAIGTASRVLREAVETVRRRWASALNGVVSDILPHLNPEYDNLLFDSSLDFTIRRVSDGRILQKAEIDSNLSTGAKDQVYLAVRLACAQALSANEAVPVILDDAFVYFDDERFESAMRCVAERISREQQVIILSCHKSRHERLKACDWFRENVELHHL